MAIELTIPGRPVAKERPRQGRGGVFYTPTKTRRFENRIAFYYFAKYGRKKLEGFLEVWISYYLKKRGREDIDNLIKTTLDGLKVAFNDKQVLHLHTAIRIDPLCQERTELEIYHRRDNAT